jgi:hypothetical protein
MKRTPKNSKPPFVRSFFPIFFWHKCDYCNIEFKGEMGWKIQNDSENKTETVMCTNCAPTMQEARSRAILTNHSKSLLASSCILSAGVKKYINTNRRS